jgi:16S rRNA (cytosine1402-N4)-methyltransferase
MSADGHAPVLASEVVEGLKVQADGFYVDATFGRGGHTRMVLQCLGSAGRVLAIDRDPQAVAAGRSTFADDSRLVIVHAPFSQLRDVLNYDVQNFDGSQRPLLGIVFDLGVSSPQLDDPGRGFSFRRDGPLDMRMDPSAGISAARWLAGVDEAELASVLRRLGEERFARRIARAVVAARVQTPLQRTGQLADLVAAAVPTREPGRHPATRTFQAIRIYLNRELDELRAVLPDAMHCLAPGGRLVVISFHSLEDRIVKRFIRDHVRGDPYPPDLPVRADQLSPLLRAVAGPVRPGRAEIEHNPRARSAVLRVAERIAPHA